MTHGVLVCHHNSSGTEIMLNMGAKHGGDEETSISSDYY